MSKAGRLIKLAHKKKHDLDYMEFEFTYNEDKHGLC